MNRTRVDIPGCTGEAPCGIHRPEELRGTTCLLSSCDPSLAQLHRTRLLWGFWWESILCLKPLWSWTRYGHYCLWCLGTRSLIPRILVVCPNNGVSPRTKTHMVLSMLAKVRGGEMDVAWMEWEVTSCWLIGVQCHITQGTPREGCSGWFKTSSLDWSRPSG